MAGGFRKRGGKGGGKGVSRVLEKLKKKRFDLQEKKKEEGGGRSRG